MEFWYHHKYRLNKENISDLRKVVTQAIEYYVAQWIHRQYKDIHKLQLKNNLREGSNYTM